ncbi:MAG: HD domain-containing protein [Proteobacteria bacterium]|nr:HD domain-containing protein [Pseudomonadota bacterium]
MEGDRLKKQLHFIREIDNLKHIIRQSYLIETQRKENSAEHSWHLAMAGLLLSEYSDEDVDLFQALKIALVHDIVEIDAGDTYCYDNITALDKFEREKKAANRIFGILPQDQENQMQELWEEFEAGVTPESKFARSLDCLLPLLHNYCTEGKSWKEHGITRDQVIDHTIKIQDISSTLWDFVRSTIDDAVAKGYLSK